MAVTDVARKRGMTHADRLLTLFKAFRERNDEAFYRAAEAIIAEELTANHHSQARELQKALSNGEERPLSRPVNGLSVLPKDRRFGEPLVSVIEPRMDANRVMLMTESRNQLDRILQEHGQRLKLAKYGYLPKTKILFWGPPGCGKTLTAHWLASELQLPLGVVRLNALITSFLGETASHIQRIFDMAQTTPMVLLIDEADAVAKDRDDQNDVGELKRVVNSLLQAMDSFRSAESIVIAASNHQYLLDNALWRRFDDVILFPVPTTNQTKSFLSLLLNGVNLSGKLDSVVRTTQSLSYSQIERGVVEVLKTMIMEDRTEVRTADIADYFKKYKTLIRTARTRGGPKPHRP
ncbi:MAG TPA: ATP-binding protein [Pirellulales bacterium]|nr:ATP-binding protein [Pirellulales bacterium]